MRADELPNGVDLAVFDLGANSSSPRAVEAMQRAPGVAANGRMGQRRSFLQQIKTF